MNQEQLFRMIERTNLVWVVADRVGKATLQLWYGPNCIYQHCYVNLRQLATDLAEWVKSGEIAALPTNEIFSGTLMPSIEEIAEGKYKVYSLPSFLYPYDEETRDGLGKLIREKINLTEMLEEGLKQ